MRVRNIMLATTALRAGLELHIPPEPHWQANVQRKIEAQKPTNKRTKVKAARKQNRGAK
jgi:hypothetical protein